MPLDSVYLQSFPNWLVEFSMFFDSINIIWGQLIQNYRNLFSDQFPLLIKASNLTFTWREVVKSLFVSHIFLSDRLSHWPQWRKVELFQGPLPPILPPSAGFSLTPTIALCSMTNCLVGSRLQRSGCQGPCGCQSHLCVTCTKPPHLPS